MTREAWRDQVDSLVDHAGIAGTDCQLRVLWDFDGVVADTEPLHDQTYQELARRRGHVLEPGYFDAMVGKTEPRIWSELIAQGFPARRDEIDDLARERQAAYLELALETLQPTWVARALVPYFAGLGAQQFIVSNGDPDSQARLLAGWGLADHLNIRRREPGEDKLGLLRRLYQPPVIVIEDNAGFLRQARAAGAATIAVRNSFNADQDLPADVIVSLLEPPER
ncbi:MAG: HAD family hydrolase [Arachnia sp.]